MKVKEEEEEEEDVAVGVSCLLPGKKELGEKEERKRREKSSFTLSLAFKSLEPAIKDSRE